MTRLAPVDAYRLWAETWDSSASPIVELERRYLSAWLRDLRGQRFIDAGCGTGRWMLHAVRAGARTFGFDLSFEMVQKAAAKSGLSGHVAVADMADLPCSENSADVVLCALSLGHCKDALAVFANLLRLPKRGGRIILSDFHPDAIRNGWKRTFRCGSQTMEVESYPYSIQDLLDVAESRGYRLEELLEMSFGPEEERMFVDAGRADLFARTRGQAAVVLISLRRR
jgi:malonyl-CoA O-methyltransferase